MKLVYRLLNPFEWLRAFQFSKKNAKFDKSSYDLELFLYSKILSNDMLHYGYFDDVDVKPEALSIEQIEAAQIKYAENIIEHIKDQDNPILDVGCGMGGLSELIHQKGYEVECLTPNKNQIAFINQKYKYLNTYNCKFEDFSTDKQYGTVINSESLQYISLKDAFDKLEKILLPDGRWIIVDYFRMHEEGINKSAHLLEDFHQKLKAYNYKIVYEQDITLNVLPTIAYVNMYAERFLVPIKHFAFEKFRFKKAVLYYMTRGLRDSIDKKIIKEKASVDPEKFLKEKKYILFVLEKK